MSLSMKKKSIFLYLVAQLLLHMGERKKKISKSVTLQSTENASGRWRNAYKENKMYILRHHEEFLFSLQILMSAMFHLDLI